MGGIGGVVLYAGGLAGDELVEMHLTCETGDVPRGVIGDAGDGVAVRNQLPSTQGRQRTGARAENSLPGRPGRRRIRADLADLACADSADLVQAQAALAADWVWLLRGAKNDV